MESDQADRFPELPQGLLTYPENRVMAYMDDPDAVVAAVEDLTEAGFERNEILVLCGAIGAERLDVSGRHHGLRGRVYRLIERRGDEHDEFVRADEHLRAGGIRRLRPC